MKGLVINMTATKSTTVDLTAEDASKIHSVISFLLDNEQYGDDWEDEIELLKKIAAAADENELIG